MEAVGRGRLRDVAVAEEDEAGGDSVMAMVMLVVAPPPPMEDLDRPQPKSAEGVGKV